MNKFLFIALSVLVLGCSKSNQQVNIDAGNTQDLYSTKGSERSVSFKALYQTNYTSLADFSASSYSVTKWDIARTVKFLFGPLVTREVGGPQRGEEIKILRNEAVLKNGFVFVPYEYKALWLTRKDFPVNGMKFPLPYQSSMRTSPKWKLCGDAAEEHQTEGFFWYFWDPSRTGCDHVEGKDYQNVTLTFGTETLQTTQTYPEYQRMVRNLNGEKVLQMTFAFGYVEDVENPNPFKDYDAGMYEFRDFVNAVEKKVSPLGFTRSAILQSEYDGSASLVIGARFTGLKEGVKVIISVVANAGVDQMYLFAESYAARQEAFFGWFGHSRVGSGFDADSFRSIVNSNPNKYELTADYQMIYWAGCNSYSYYTLPFFDMKASLNPTLDPKGTKNLDIISNGLPSFFSVNAINAEIALDAILNWNQPTSFQSIVNKIETESHDNMGNVVLVNVLGDEDNQ